MDKKKGEVSLAEYVTVIWRRRLFVILCTLLAMIAAAVVTVFQPNVYQATAALVLLPPKFQTELNPSTLSIHTYMNLLKAPELVKAVIDTLGLDGATVEGLASDLKTEIIEERYGIQRIAYSPLIFLYARGESPRMAADIANTWAEVFVAQNRNLSSKGKEGSLKFIEDQFPVSKEKLEKTEDVLRTRQDYYENAVKELKDAWQKRIFAFKARWKIDLMKKELGVVEKKVIDFESELIDVRVSIKTTRDDLEQIQAEMKNQPQFIVMAKAITDDALWERVGSDTTGGLPGQLDELKLRSERLNPVYENLSQRLANTQITLQTLIPKERYVADEIRSKKEEADSLRRVIYDKELELAQLERQRDAELQMLDRKKDLELGRLKRDAENFRETYTTLAQKSESARLAKAEESEDIKIAARAVEPGRKVAPNRKRDVLVAGLIALIASVLVAFLLEYTTTKRPRVEEKASSRL